MPGAYKGGDYGVGHEEVEAKTDCEEENEPNEGEKVADVAPVGAGDVLRIHSTLYSMEPTSTRPLIPWVTSNVSEDTPTDFPCFLPSPSSAFRTEDFEISLT